MTLQSVALIDHMLSDMPPLRFADPDAVALRLSESDKFGCDDTHVRCSRSAGTVLKWRASGGMVLRWALFASRNQINSCLIIWMGGSLQGISLAIDA